MLVAQAVDDTLREERVHVLLNYVEKHFFNESQREGRRNIHRSTCNQIIHLYGKNRSEIFGFLTYHGRIVKYVIV